MLKIKTYLDKSPIHGIGLFAAENIRKGKRVWEWDYSFDKVTPESLIKPYKDFIKHYGYKMGTTWFICLDNARFMNHENKPSVTCLEGYDIAARNIKKGEELTCDYSKFCEDFKGFKK